MSATAAVPVRYGSTTTSLAPRSFRARAICVITLTCVDTGLPPHITIRSERAISRGSGPMKRPTPAIQPASQIEVQIVLACRE